METFRSSEIVRSFGSALTDQVGTTGQLERVAEVLPEEWSRAAAYGTPEECVSTIREQLDLGATGVIMHGATPDELEPVVEAFRKETAGKVG